MESIAAFLSAVVVTEKAMGARPQKAPPFAGLSCLGQEEGWHAVYTTSAELWPASTHEVDNRCISEVLPRVQNFF